MQLRSLLVKLFTIALLLLGGISFGQEFVCRVQIDDEQAQTQERQIFVEMKTTIEDFVNNRNWTDDVYEVDERIKLYINIQITTMSGLTNFRANAQIRASRPVYGTDYETVCFQFIDKNFDFIFQQGRDLVYNDNTFTDDLTSYLAFYANIVLGYDRDSFSELGGKKYFNQALTIMNNVPPNRSPGWEARDANNRYALTSQLNNPQFEDMRKGLYQYHRHALDIFTEKPIEAHQIILETLNTIKELRRIVPTSIVIETFFLSKKMELVNIFKGAEDQLRQQAAQLLRQVDPTNAQAYLEMTR